MNMGKLIDFKNFFTEENVKARFLKGIKKLSNGCWKWSKHTGTDHYGQLWSKGSARPAHIVAYELYKGKAPAGKVLMHTCQHRWCCNPAHLKPGTKKENNIDTAKQGHSRNQHTKSRTLKGSPKDTGDRE